MPHDLKSWASRRPSGSARPTVPPPPAAPMPPPQPAPVQPQAPVVTVPAGTVYPYPPQIYGHMPLMPPGFMPGVPVPMAPPVMVGPPPQTCTLVRSDDIDPYAAMMAAIPEQGWYVNTPGGPMHAPRLAQNDMMSGPDAPIAYKRPVQTKGVELGAMPMPPVPVGLDGQPPPPPPAPPPAQPPPAFADHIGQMLGSASDLPPPSTKPSA